MLVQQVSNQNFFAWLYNPQDLIERTRGNDALRCRAEVLDNGEFYRCSRDAGHTDKLHLCVDYGVYISFGETGEENLGTAATAEENK